MATRSPSLAERLRDLAHDTSVPSVQPQWVSERAKLGKPLGESLPAQRSGQKKQHLEEGDDEKRAGPKRQKVGDDDDVKESKQEAAPEEADEEVEDDEFAEEEKTPVQAVKRRNSQGYKRKPGKEPTMDRLKEQLNKAKPCCKQLRCTEKLRPRVGELFAVQHAIWAKKHAVDRRILLRQLVQSNSGVLPVEEKERERAAGIGLGIDRGSNEKDEKDEKDERPRKQAIILDTTVCRKFQALIYCASRTSVWHAREGRNTTRKAEVILSSPCSSSSSPPVPISFLNSHLAAVLVGREICVAGFEPALLVGCLRLLFGMRGCQTRISFA